MKAMVLRTLCKLEEDRAPLTPMEVPKPVPAANEVLIRVSVCGVCHTELDVIEGRTPPPHLPLILGHQVVGHIDACGSKAKAFKIGERVGIAWIYSACGVCKFCRSGNENLCREFRATGRDVDGGYAEYMTVPEDFAHRIPEVIGDSETAPLLCAGAIGYRSLRLTGLEDGQKLGLTGFGASGHLVLKLAQHRYPNSRIFVFARSEQQRIFARELGAVWAGGTEEHAPEKLDCIIDTTPAWQPVVAALANLEPGGRLVINAIGKEERDKKALLSLDYPAHIWMEKEIKSVANICRSDVGEFLLLAAAMGIRPEIQEFTLEEANAALVELKTRKIRGAKVLRVG
jgi:alcohol dehydrogenase, propanol-preferring